MGNLSDVNALGAIDPERDWSKTRMTLVNSPAELVQKADEFRSQGFRTCSADSPRDCWLGFWVFDKKEWWGISLTTLKSRPSKVSFATREDRFNLFGRPPVPPQDVV